MPKVMAPRRHTKFYDRYTLILVLLWVAVGYYFNVFNEESEDVTVIRVLYFIGVLSSLVTISWLRKVEFKCPSCDTPIPTPIDKYVKGGAPIYHYCKKCDVLWHVDNENIDD